MPGRNLEGGEGMLAYPRLGAGGPKSAVGRLASRILQCGERRRTGRRRDFIHPIEIDFPRVGGADRLVMKSYGEIDPEGGSRPHFLAEDGFIAERPRVRKRAYQGC